MQSQARSVPVVRRYYAISPAVACELCHHEAVLPTDAWPDAVLVHAFRPRMMCNVCGIVGAYAQPNWKETQASGNWRTGAPT